jgi:acyl dehydratase
MGDYNPLHADPAVAARPASSAPFCMAGQLRPGGLACCANARAEPARLKALDVRFAAPVYPGETLVTEIWRAPGPASSTSCAPACWNATRSC